MKRKQQKRQTQMGLPLLLSILFTKLVQRVSQFSTCLELSNFLGSNLNLLLSSRIDTLTSGALANGECSETNESYLVTSDEGILDGSYSSVESLLGISFGQT